jgi:hypothetical protein
MTEELMTGILELARRKLQGRLLIRSSRHKKAHRVVKIDYADIETGCGYLDCSVSEPGLLLTFSDGTTMQARLDSVFFIQEEANSATGVM